MDLRLLGWKGWGETEVKKSKAPDPAVRNGSGVVSARKGQGGGGGVGTQPVPGKLPLKHSPSPRLGL